MKKRNGWKWMLALTVLFGMGFLSNLTSPMYDDFVRWPITAALTAVLACLTVWMRSKAKKAEAEDARKKIEAMEEARKKETEAEAARKAEETRRAEEERARRDRFRHEKFAVAGVTFKNEDKTDRQQILREIALNADGSCAVAFEEDEEKGEDSAIRVMTEYGCVGHVRHNDKAKIRRFFDRKVNTMVLAVERFENDDGEKIYRADIVIGMDREDPEQRWYFDELPES